MSDRATVTVTFKIEADDPEHSTGVSGETFDEITDAIMQLGGEDIRFNVDETDG
jgi:hypothetical protein